MGEASRKTTPFYTSIFRHSQHIGVRRGGGFGGKHNPQVVARGGLALERQLLIGAAIFVAECDILGCRAAQHRLIEQVDIVIGAAGNSAEIDRDRLPCAHVYRIPLAGSYCLAPERAVTWAAIGGERRRLSRAGIRTCAGAIRWRKCVDHNWEVD